jgi:hypothetical protein
MAFQLARSPDVANWPYRPEDVARCFGWNKPPMGFQEVREVMGFQEVREVDFLELGGLLPEKQMRSLHEWGAKIIERGLHPSSIHFYPDSPEIKLFIKGSLRARGTLVNGVLKVTSLVDRKKAFEWK